MSFAKLVMVSGASEELQMRRGFLLVCSKKARWEILIRLPKKREASGTERIMLNPLWERSRSSCRQEEVEVSDIAEVCRPFAIPALMDAVRYHPYSA